MANFYTEVPELKFQLNNPMMERICELKERGYQDKDKFDYAPQDYADAMDSYDKVLHRRNHRRDYQPERRRCRRRRSSLC